MTYITPEIAKKALPLIRESFELLELSPEDDGWGDLFQVQLELERIIKEAEA